MYNNAFDNNEQLLAFFDGLGLQPRVLNQVNATPNVVSLDVLKLSHQILDTAKSKLRLWVLSVHDASSAGIQSPVKASMGHGVRFIGSGCRHEILQLEIGRGRNVCLQHALH